MKLEKKLVEQIREKLPGVKVRYYQKKQELKKRLEF